MDQKDIEYIAMSCHERNKTYCESLGDHSQPHWHDAPDWQKNSAMQGVEKLLENPELTPEQMHRNWSIVKLDDGWKYGPVKYPEKKEHPCLVSYKNLPEDQRKKDDIFRSTVFECLSKLEAMKALS